MQREGDRKGGMEREGEEKNIVENSSDHEDNTAQEK